MARPSTLSPRNVQSSPLRPSPDRRQISDYLSDDRNSEASHNEALEYARLEHTRVRLNAIRISEIHQLQEEQKRISEQQKKEQERLLAETALREEQERLRKLQAKKVEPLPPQPDPPKLQEKQPAPPPKVAAQPAVNGAAATASAAPQAPAKVQPVAAQQPQIQAPAAASPFAKAEPAKASPSPFAQAAPKPSPFAQQTNGAAPAAAPKPAPQPAARPAPAAPPAAQDAYVKIHQELKKVRKVLGEQSKMAGSPLKGKLGDLRRNIRKSVSQLSGVKGANNQAINTIVAALQESLNPRTPSDPINASLFVTDNNRQPVEGAALNSEQLPSAFIYLLNHFAKAIILQFTTEASVNPKAVEPVGIVTAHIFSNPAFHWRGKTLIDILIAKFRISCPVLFGVYGSEDTERGRAALGWRKEDGGWVTNRTHMDRMTGLGAGFASISLRDFSKASKTNPYPPSNYWKAVAAIINTPAGRTTNTHYKVLSSMLDSHEARFIQFYGNAAIAALRMAIVEFPKRAPPNSQEAQSLQVLGQLLQKNSGLVLA
ncbi:GLE1-like protein [Plectosphaerella plurivora]|uniref:mRNA export factor GLE1 n=1 Tax=Plectosphaerella plurivora TaxID=936078 RepID=A0A9P9A9W1_9PEZI|nr:GLE1-like protein [Plectosphaerella plurivora]